MSNPESTSERLESASERPDASPPETERTLLGSIEFLTGREPVFGSFLLVVGMVTCVFVALFQFTLPPPISHILTAGVLFVTVLSAVFAMLLDSFGYFGPAATAGKTGAVRDTDERRASARPWVPAERPSVPLPPLLNFDTELRAYADMFDGDLPAAFDPFISDYRRLKTNTRNRPTIASDLRADLNPIGTLFEDGSKGDRIYEDISDRLFRYISAQTSHVTLDDVEVYDQDGTETNVGALADQPAHIEFTITNEGEPAAVDLTVTLYDSDDAAISSHTCTAGTVSPGATKVVETPVFIPRDAESAGTRFSVSDAPVSDTGSRRKATGA